MNNEKWIICKFHVRPCTFLPSLPRSLCKIFEICISGLQFHFLFFSTNAATQKFHQNGKLWGKLCQASKLIAASALARKSKIEIWNFSYISLRVFGKRKYPFIIDLTNFSLQFLQHIFKAVVPLDAFEEIVSCLAASLLRRVLRKVATKRNKTKQNN